MSENSRQREQRGLAAAIIVCFILMIILGWLPLISWFIVGLVAG